MNVKEIYPNQFMIYPSRENLGTNTFRGYLCETNVSKICAIIKSLFGQGHQVYISGNMYYAYRSGGENPWNTSLLQYIPSFNLNECNVKTIAWWSVYIDGKSVAKKCVESEKGTLPKNQLRPEIAR